MRKNILVVEDDEIFLMPLHQIISEAGYRTATAGNVAGALNLLRGQDFDLVLTDNKLPDGSGVELIRTTKAENPDIAVIMMTAYGSVESAVEAIKLGAEDYILKPFEDEQILLAIEKALKFQELSATNKYRTNQRSKRFTFENIIAQSKSMTDVFHLAKKTLNLDTTLLIYGETGTGKELLANAIHYNGPRRDKPFIKVNCAAIPDELFESELFGYKKGAFTGAHQSKKGFFQMANGGTILLDEIGEIPTKLQAKLLRVIENKQVISLGSERSVDLDVRIIATTNKDLESEVEKGNFREDLFYRLSVTPIKLPPLRERKEDIPLIAAFFLKKYAKKFNKPIKSISWETMNRLINYSWPGNVRELENIIERAVIITDGEEVTEINNFLHPRKNVSSNDFSSNFRAAKENFERSYILKLLQLYGWNVSQASRHAAISLSNLWAKMKKHGIKPPPKSKGKPS